MFQFSRVLLVSAALAAAGLATMPVVAQPSFQGLGDFPGAGFYSAATGVSADGAVVVGTGAHVDPYQYYEAFRWTQAGGMVGLGVLPGGSGWSHARGVSADGAVVVGDGSYSDGWVAFRWTQAGGMVGLGDLPGGGFYSRAFDVSADGAVVVGTGSSAGPFQYEAFRWTQAGGMIGLGYLPGGVSSSLAFGVSDDGAVVVGYGDTANGAEAFRWTQAGGMVGLGDLPGGVFRSIAYDVSADGAVVVGQGNYDVNCDDPNSPCVYFDEAVRWTQAGGMVGLGHPPGGPPLHGHASSVSADGAVVVGGNDYGVGYWVPFIWDAAHGMRNLRDVLTAAGLNLTGWQLTEPPALSADGRTIVGRGRNPSGQEEAWIARLGPVCPGDVNGDSVIDLSDLTILLANFGTPSGATLADGDLSGDGDVDLGDLTLLLSNFGATCS